jgi:alanyl-tRNA synthetase
MTTRLYYDDSQARAFEARITEYLTHDGQPAVVLDRTLFYPTGGGQPHDTGTLDGVPVVEVVARQPDLAVVHVLAHALPADREQVRGELDWARRFDHMQQHTGQHILTQALVTVCEANTVGFHLSPASVTIDLDRTDLTPAQLAEAERLANQVVWDDQPVTARIYATVDQLRAAGVRMRRLPDHIATDGLRVVEIGTFDATACGGTHVRASGQVGVIKLLKAEKRGDKLRVEFACGGRALADHAERLTVTQRLTAQLTAGLADLPELVKRLQDQLADAQRAYKQANQILLEQHADALLASAAPVGGVRVVRWATDQHDAEALRGVAKRMTAHAGVVALLGCAGEKAHLVLARSADLATLNLNPALKAAFAVLGGGRGGGSPDFVQGGGVPATVAQCEAALQDAYAVVTA